MKAKINAGEAPTMPVADPSDPDYSKKLREASQKRLDELKERLTRMRAEREAEINQRMGQHDNIMRGHGDYERPSMNDMLRSQFPARPDIDSANIGMPRGPSMPGRRPPRIPLAGGRPGHDGQGLEQVDFETMRTRLMQRHPDLNVPLPTNKGNGPRGSPSPLASRMSSDDIVMDDATRERLLRGEVNPEELGRRRPAQADLEEMRRRLDDLAASRRAGVPPTPPAAAPQPAAAAPQPAAAAPQPAAAAPQPAAPQM
eukprot:GAFH01003842.1.p1 GENE.GAFH01003842.1~~GAFH01003842.1.p1  ORF type:complete len:277 (-),score=53.38 GAFH01003842.1:48-818(-)